MTLNEIREIVGKCKFDNWDIQVREDGTRPYLQIHVMGTDNMTGLPLEWTGRKWMLSPFMCRNEIVNTAFKAVLCAMEHEVKEKFTYRGVAIFNPHLDPDRLVDFARDPVNIQERKNSEFGV